MACRLLRGHLSMPTKRGHDRSLHVAQIAQSFEPARLTLTRALRGRTRGELAEPLQLTGQQLARPEAGHSGARPKTMARFALPLGPRGRSFPPGRAVRPS